MINIIITGSEGFIGKQLTNHFKSQKGYNVYPLDIISKTNNSSKIIDLNDKKKLFKYFRDKKIDYIFHLASISDIDFSVKYPEKTLKNNIFSLLNVLNLSLYLNIKKIIFSSTIYTKGNKGSFYRISKNTCEDIIMEYQRLHKLDFAIIRYGSVYGNGAPHTNSIKDLALQIKKKRIVVRKGTGEEIRSYININDAINLTARIIKKKYTNVFVDIKGSSLLKSSNLIKYLQDKYENKKFIFDGKENFHHYRLSPKSKVIYKNIKLLIKKDLNSLKEEIYQYTETILNDKK